MRALERGQPFRRLQPLEMLGAKRAKLALDRGKPLVERIGGLADRVGARAAERRDAEGIAVSHARALPAARRRRSGALGAPRDPRPRAVIAP
ncbi:MAG: hypothetical protein WDN44_15450 [Sphingomonas sp.]